MTYGKSTYAQLIDVLLGDVDDVRVKKVTAAAWMDTILRAEQQICRLATVREEFTLRYALGVTDYPIETRPAITGATNVTPIVLSSTAHGIPNYVRVRVLGVQGNEAANGFWFTSAVAANALTLNKGAYVSGVEIDGSGIATVSTETEHGFDSSDSIYCYGINNVPDAYYGITVVSTTTFTLTATLPVADYEDGGVVLATNSSTGSGTYVGGGRITRDNELPGHFGKFLEAHGTYRGYNFDSRGMQKDDLDASRSRAIFNFGPPNSGSVYVSGGRKYLRIDPPPDTTADMIITGEVQIVPTECYGELESMQIHLSSEYDDAITAFMKSRAYERIGNPDMMTAWEKRFSEAVKVHNLNEPNRRMRVSAD